MARGLFPSVKFSGILEKEAAHLHKWEKPLSTRSVLAWYVDGCHDSIFLAGVSLKMFMSLECSSSWEN